MLRLYWCGDDCVRGCILRKTFNVLGFDVLVPVSGPSPSSGKVPKRSSMYVLGGVTRSLAGRGCTDLADIDERWGVKPLGRGDIDFVTFSKNSGVAFVAEVKTRLIVWTIKNYNIEVLRLMLQYHLDAPPNAERAWARLVKRGIVKPPRRGAREYDNPASIAELTRAVAAFTLNTSRSIQDLSSVVPGVVTLCYATPVLNDLLTYVNNTYAYLRSCGVEVEEPVAIVLHPDTVADVPRSITVSCVGKGCGKLGLASKAEIPQPLGGCAYSYLACRDCPYRRICSRICSGELYRYST